jgi:hypothetical protein
VKTNAKTRTLLACGVIGGPLFVATFLVEDATHANYDPLRHPVSSLALSDSGWVQGANFIVTGLLTLAFAPACGARFSRGRARPWDHCWSGYGRSVCSARGSLLPIP